MEMGLPLMECYGIWWNPSMLTVWILNVYFFLFKMIVGIFLMIVTMSLFDYVKNSDYYSKILRTTATKPQE